MRDDLKITINCHKCSYLKNFNSSNKELLNIEELNYKEITNIYSSLICSVCRSKNPEITRENKYSLVNYPAKICSIDECDNPILIPRLKSLDNKVNTCILCASGDNNFKNTQVIFDQDYKNKRIIEIKKLKKRCAFINEISEFNVCKNAQIRLIATIEKRPYVNEIKSVLGEDNILFKNHSKSIEKILINYQKQKIIQSKDYILF